MLSDLRFSLSGGQVFPFDPESSGVDGAGDCQHCRADALGIPGKGKDLHALMYQDRTEQVAETFSHG